MGELDCVTDQVDENLPQPGHVANQRGGERVVDGAGELQIFLARPGPKQVQHILDARPQRERMLLDLHLAALDL